MALFHSCFFSDVLGMQSRAEVILPDRLEEGRPLPTLYLLHGLSDDETIWCRHTCLELYARGYYLAVVMPNAHRSFYLDSDDGHTKYFTYITEELPKLMESFFPLAKEREHRFIAGLSMGGYGAFKCALARPDRYAAAASFSGVMDFVQAVQNWDFLQTHVCEDSASAAPSNLFASAEQLMTLAKLSPDVKVPKLYQECGTEDFLYQQNIAFRDFATKLGMPHEYHERPGTHNWEFWNECIRKTLAWLPLQTESNKTKAIGV